MRHRGKKKTSCMFDSTFCCLVSTRTSNPRLVWLLAVHLQSLQGTWGHAACVCARACVCVCTYAGGWGLFSPCQPLLPFHPSTLTRSHPHSHSYRWCAVRLHFHHCDDECSCQTPGNQSHICSCLCRHGDTAQVCTTTSTWPEGDHGWRRK